MLQFTSFLFAPVVLHAHAVGHHLYHGLVLVVLSLSIAHHSLAATAPGAVLIARLDKLAAHVLFAAVVATESEHMWRLAMPAVVAGLWFSERVWPRHAVALHGLLHAFAAAGLHALLMR